MSKKLSLWISRRVWTEINRPTRRTL